MPKRKAKARRKASPTSKEKATMQGDEKTLEETREETAAQTTGTPFVPPEPAPEPQNRELKLKLSPEMVDAADSGDVDAVLKLRGRTINFRKTGRKNSFGEIGTKIELEVPCSDCGFGLFYNDAAGAECLVCGRMHKA